METKQGKDIDHITIRRGDAKWIDDIGLAGEVVELLQNADFKPLVMLRVAEIDIATGRTKVYYVTRSPFELSEIPEDRKVASAELLRKSRLMMIREGIVFKMGKYADQYDRAMAPVDEEQQLQRDAGHYEGMREALSLIDHVFNKTTNR